MVENARKFIVGSPGLEHLSLGLIVSIDVLGCLQEKKYFAIL